MKVFIHWNYPKNKVGVMFSSRDWASIEAVIGVYGRNWFFGIMRFGDRIPIEHNNLEEK